MIVADGAGGADIESALSGVDLFWGFGLFKKVDVGLVLIVFEEFGGFFEANMARGTAIVDVPRTRNVFFEDACFVGHRVHKIHRQGQVAILERFIFEESMPGAGVEPARGFLPKGF